MEHACICITILSFILSSNNAMLKRSFYFDLVLQIYETNSIWLETFICFEIASKPNGIKKIVIINQTHLN